MYHCKHDVKKAYITIMRLLKFKRKECKFEKSFNNEQHISKNNGVHRAGNLQAIDRQISSLVNKASI